MILVLSLCALAESPALSLPETLRLVVERNPDHTAASLGEQIAAIDARRARLDRFTAQISADAGGSAGFVKPWDAEIYGTSDANWDARANLGVPLYAGGRVQASIDSADAAEDIARRDRVITDRALVRAAYTAYWTIKGYELQIQASEEGLALTEEAMRIITAKADAGLVAGIDTNRSRVDLYAQQESLISARASLYGAEQELLRLLHMDGDDVVLTDEPGVASTAAVELPADAGQGRPELERLALEAEQAEAGVRLARAAALPTLSLTGTAGVGGSSFGTAGRDFLADELRPAIDASVGLQLTWNPFDLFSVRDAVAQARLGAERVAASTESQKADISADIRKAASSVRELRERVPLVEAQVALARDNLQIVQGLYAQGSATILDLFDAQSSFRQARTQGASLRVSLTTAEYDLRWLLGEDLTEAR